MPHAIPCYLQTVKFYGVDNWANRTLLGTFLNEQRLGFAQYIHTLRYHNDFIVTWEESPECYPIRLSISLSSWKGLIDVQEIPAQTEMAKFQYIPQDDQITVCVTSSHLYDDFEHLTTCTQETPVFRPKMDMKLELATNGSNLTAAWTENSKDTQHLIFLLIKDERLYTIDYLPANQTVHTFGHDPCAHYMAVLFVTGKTGLDYFVDAASYKPVLPWVKDIQVYHVGTDILVKWHYDEVSCKPSKFVVMLLNLRHEKFAEADAMKTSTVLFKNCSPNGIYHIRIIWKLDRKLSLSSEYAVGLENVKYGWQPPTLNIVESETSMLLSWDTIDPHIDFYTVIMLEHGLIKKVDHLDPQTTNMKISNTNPCTQYEFSVGARSNASNQFYDFGQITYEGGLPSKPQVTYLGGSRVHVKWTTNKFCKPDRIYVHLRAPAHHMAPVVVTGTEDFIVVTGVKQCTMYTIQLSFSFLNGQEYLSEPVRMTFFSDGLSQMGPKLTLEEGGSLMVKWLLHPDCIADRTTVTVETNGVGVKNYHVYGHHPWIQLKDLEPCAFHTVYVTIRSLDGFILRTNSSEINSFMKKFELVNMKTYISDGELLVQWEPTGTCHVLGYRIDLVNPITGLTKYYLTNETKYYMSIDQCTKTCQLLISVISVNTIAPITAVITVRPDQVPDQPQPPFVRRDGSILFISWTNSHQTSDIESYKLSVTDAMNGTRIFKVQHPRNSKLLEGIKEDAVYKVNLRAVNEEGESKSSMTVQLG
ncbi:hypothetical protein PHET_02088 [Paragonimus heterotremus]|uniref:Fibronectin type-III domain-containing protein n=1 Tax=Paragonimus heterotremus TaxID=100268 RepID=A0A8J4TR02_9TREM|nr:hypothetical protein PHET_02088 [Paragonimus heterotremus]